MRLSWQLPQRETVSISSVKIPQDFSSWLEISNVRERFDEALEIAAQTATAGIELFESLDHAVIFTDPSQLVAGPLKRLGYEIG